MNLKIALWQWSNAVQSTSVKEDRRRLVDRDPQTALANRRALVFFDLNAFKRINDQHGHQAGDECLTRFAAALLDSFRPQDALVRYAGDELLVVASGLTAASVEERVETLRGRLRAVGRGEIAIAFSHGTSELAAGGQPDAALRAADEAMHRAKAEVTV